MNSSNLVGLASLGDWGSIFYLSLGFALGAAILGFSIVPKFVRLAFFLSSFIFLSSTSTSYFAVVQSGLLSASPEEMSEWLKAVTSFGEVQLLQFSIGLVASVLFSLTAYVTLLVATWVSGLVLSRYVYSIEETTKESLFNIVVLLCLVIFFSSDLPIKYFLYLDQFKASQSISSATIVGKIIALGELSFIYALILALPLFIASIAVDLFAILINRYFTEFASQSKIFSIKIPILVAGLAIMLIPFSEQIAVLMNQSVTEETLRGLFR